MLKERRVKVRDSLFLAYRNLQRGVRTDDNWKLIKYNVRGRETTQLFNLNQDPWEMNNLVRDSQHRERLEDLTTLLKVHMRKLDDLCDLEKPNWGLPEEKYEIVTVSHLAAGKKVKLTDSAKHRYADK